MLNRGLNNGVINNPLDVSPFGQQEKMAAGTPPPIADYLITQSGDYFITESGDFLISQP